MKKIFSRIPRDFLWLAFISLVVYWPSFVTEFAMYNDSTMIPVDLSRENLYGETPHLIMIGRALLAVLLNALGWCVRRTSELAFYRTLVFFFLFGFVFVFLRFLKRRFALSPFWLFLIGAGIILSPPAQLCAVWLIVGFQCVVTVWPAMASYFLLDKCWPMGPNTQWPAGKAGILGVSAAAVLFMAALYIYQPNAMIVFIFPFSYLMFGGLDRLRVTRKIILRDLVFYGVLMLLYFVMCLKWNTVILNAFGPWEREIKPYIGSMYESAVEAIILTKLKVLVGIVQFSWNGMWPLVFGRAGAWLALIPIIFIAGISAVNQHRNQARFHVIPPTSGAGTGGRNCLPVKCQGTMAVKPWGSIRRNLLKIIQAMLAGGILFLLANTPVLLAKGCDVFIGYRVLFVSSCFIQILLFGSIYHLARGIHRKLAMLYTKGILILFMILMVIIAARHVAFCAMKFNKQLRFIREKTLSAREDTQRVMVIRLPENPSMTQFGKNLPYEFNGMIGFEPFVNEVRAGRGLPQLPVDKDLEEIVFYDTDTLVIDANQILEDEDQQSRRHKPLVRLSASSLAGQKVGIYREGAYFVFNQILQNTRVHFWASVPSEGTLPWFQLEFDDEGREIWAFSFGASETSPGRFDPMSFQLQGSVDGGEWDDLKTRQVWQSPDELYLKAFVVMQPAVYKFYRFLLSPEGNQWPLHILAIQMDLKVDLNK